MTQTLETTCCIAGGGPAGMMLGYLLARSGVPVTVLEKHDDFFRDFRGDTIHASTLQVFHELALLDDLLSVPHQKVTSFSVMFGGTRIPVADFRNVPGRSKFTALMPQWDFLNFLSMQAKKFPAFDLRMGHEVVDLTQHGAIARQDGKSIEVRADLVVGCDGRSSTVRRAAGLKVVEFGVPIDVLWFRIRRGPDDPSQVLGNVNYGKALVLINRGTYFQAGLIIRKGSFESIKARGLDAFRKTILQVAPYFDDRVNELRDWDQIKILTVQLNRLKRWYGPGVLCIGDAAHAMSPAGGVGINLAIQDAIAAANLLTEPLRERRLSIADLKAVQRRREWPAGLTQLLQAGAHKAFDRLFESEGPITAPWQIQLATRIPGVQRVLGYIVGVGIRPEHIGHPGKPKRKPRSLAIAIGAALGAAAGVAVAILSSRRREAQRELAPRLMLHSRPGLPAFR